MNVCGRPVDWKSLVAANQEAKPRINQDTTPLITYSKRPGREKARIPPLSNSVPT